MSKTSEQKAAYKRDVGRRLEEERNAQNLSRRYVADQLDIVEDSYYRIEKGQLLLSPYHLETLRKVLKFDMDYVLYGIDKNKDADALIVAFEHSDADSRNRLTKYILAGLIRVLDDKKNK